jgi:hypothetical protein
MGVAEVENTIVIRESEPIAGKVRLYEAFAGPRRTGARWLTSMPHGDLASRIAARTVAGLPEWATRQALGR